MIGKKILSKNTFSSVNVKDLKRILFRPFILSFIFIFLLLFLYSFFIAPNWICKTRLILISDKFSHDDHPIKLIHLTDFHLDKIGYREKKIISIVQEEEPDLILLSGDYLNDKSLKSELAFLIRKFQETAPVYFALGNWDSEQEWQVIKDSGGTSVHETNRLINLNGIPLNIFSVKYAWAGWPESEERKHLEEVCPKDRSIFSIMLAHTPDHFPIASEFGIDLILAGHTHGGQINIPFLSSEFIYSEYGDKYKKGLFRKNKSTLYVNRGIGMSGNIKYRLRFLSRPEILILTLKPGSKNV